MKCLQIEIIYVYAHSDRSTITTLPATAAISVYFREKPPKSLCTKC